MNDFSIASYAVLVRFYHAQCPRYSEPAWTVFQALFSFARQRSRVQVPFFPFLPVFIVVSEFFFCMTELFPIFILYFTLCEHEPVNLLSTLKGSLAELSYCTVLTNFYFCIGVHVVSFYMRYIHCCLASQGNDIYYWLLIVWSIGCLEMFGSFVEFRCYFVSRSQLKWLGNQADKGEIGEEPSDWRSDIELISSFSDPLMCEERDNFDATSFDLETEGDADLVRHGSHKRFR